MRQSRGYRRGGWAQAGAKRSLSPALRSTAKNHSADAPAPAAIRAIVLTVKRIRWLSL